MKKKDPENEEEILTVHGWTSKVLRNFEGSASQFYVTKKKVESSIHAIDFVTGSLDISPKSIKELPIRQMQTFPGRFINLNPPYSFMRRIVMDNF